MKGVDKKGCCLLTLTKVCSLVSACFSHKSLTWQSSTICSISTNHDRKSLTDSEYFWASGTISSSCSSLSTVAKYTSFQRFSRSSKSFWRVLRLGPGSVFSKTSRPSLRSSLKTISLKVTSRNIDWKWWEKELSIPWGTIYDGSFFGLLRELINWAACGEPSL